MFADDTPVACPAFSLEVHAFPEKGWSPAVSSPVVSMVKGFALLALWNAFVIGSLPTVLDQAEQAGIDHNSHLTSSPFSAGVAPYLLFLSLL